MVDTVADTTTGKTPAAKAGTTGANDKRAEAKSHFNAAVEEAKAGAAALKSEAKDRAASYKEQADGKRAEWSDEAKVKVGELAQDGKAKASGALAGLSKVAADNAGVIDEKLGSRYGDYARSASRSLQDTADRLDNKSVEELTEDAREFVRNSPGTAIGIAALAGFFFARILRK